MGTSWQNHDPNRLTLRNAVGAFMDATLCVAEWVARHAPKTRNRGKRPFDALD